jgi:hypothetical protein
MAGGIASQQDSDERLNIPFRPVPFRPVAGARTKLPAAH